MNKDLKIIARKTFGSIGIAAVMFAGIIGFIYSLGVIPLCKREESAPNIEYIIQNAEILEFKNDLDYLTLRDKTNTNNSIKLRCGDVEQFEPPKKELAKRYQKPFALVREFDYKTNAQIYPLNGISPRRFIR